MCLDINSENERIKGYVLTTGIVYGLGERQLLPLFKSAILQNPDELTIIGEGKNFIPMIHITDLCQVVEQIVFNKPAKKYYLLSDSSETTQYELVKTIADAVGNGKIKLVPK
jgi:adenylate kinase